MVSAMHRPNLIVAIRALPTAAHLAAVSALVAVSGALAFVFVGLRLDGTTLAWWWPAVAMSTAAVLCARRREVAGVVIACAAVHVLSSVVAGRSWQVLVAGLLATTAEMLLKEMGAAVAGWRFEIIGTDLSGEVLERAKAGVYTQFEVQRGLPIQMLLKYFTQNGDLWTIAPDIRAMVHYRTLNLLDSAVVTGDDIWDARCE